MPLSEKVRSIFEKVRSTFLFTLEGEQSNVTRAFNCNRHFALVSGTGACHAAGKNLCPLGHTTAQTRNILIIDIIDFINAEAAHLAAAFTASRTF
jgi:hypothetical protein